MTPEQKIKFIQENIANTKVKDTLLPDNSNLDALYKKVRIAVGRKKHIDKLTDFAGDDLKAALTVYMNQFKTEELMIAGKDYVLKALDQVYAKRMVYVRSYEKKNINKIINDLTTQKDNIQAQLDSALAKREKFMTAEK